MILTSSAEAPAAVGLVAVAAPAAGGDLAAAVAAVVVVGFAATGEAVDEAAGFAAASGDFAFCEPTDGKHSAVVSISPQSQRQIDGCYGCVVRGWEWDMLHVAITCGECKRRPLACETMESDGIAASHGRQWTTQLEWVREPVSMCRSEWVGGGQGRSFDCVFFLTDLSKVWSVLTSAPPAGASRRRSISSAFFPVMGRSFSLRRSLSCATWRLQEWRQQVVECNGS